MAKRLAVTVDDEVCQGSRSVIRRRRISRRRISRFLNDLARPPALPRDLAAGHRAMAADEGREAAERAEALI